MEGLESTGNTPKALESRPPIEEGFISIINGFSLLFRGDPMSLTDIREYCDMFGIWDVQRFAILIKAAESQVLQSRDKKSRDNKEK